MEYKINLIKVYIKANSLLKYCTEKNETVGLRKSLRMGRTATNHSIVSPSCQGDDVTFTN